MSRKNSYRLNCDLPLMYKDRLNAYCERTGLTKSSVTVMALDMFLNQKDLETQLSKLVLSDPVMYAEICSKFVPNIEATANHE